MARKRRSFGTVQELPSGRHRARYRHPTSGAWVSAPKTFLLEVQADAWLREAKQAIDDGVWIDPDDSAIAIDTVAGFATDYIQRHRLAPNSIKRYNTARRLFLKYPIELPIGGRLLMDIDSADVQLFYMKVFEERGETNAANAYKFLKSILNNAVAVGRITRAPLPKRKFGQPSMTKVGRRPTIFLDNFQIAALRSFMPQRLALMVDLGAYLGMRRSEIFGLRRCDIDFDARTITVAEQQDDPINGVAVRRPTKSSDSRGEEIPTDMHLSEALAEVVVAHLDEFTGTEDDALLFRAEKGGPLYGWTFDKAWNAAKARCVAAGFLSHAEAEIKFHGLRHLAASQLARMTNASVAEVQRFLRQSDPNAALHYTKIHRDDHARLVSELASDYVADIDKVIPLRKRAS